MKKIIALLLALTLCCGIFAGCAGDDKKQTTIEDALEYLNSMYKADEGKKTPADYKLAAQIDIEGTKFEITWASSNPAVTFVLENGLYTAKVPAKNDTEAEYTLTATVKSADGKTVTKEFKRILPVYDNSAVVSELTEGEPYKMYLVQANAGKTLFALGTTQNNENKFIQTDVDPKKGLDFYAEKVEGGYKFYTTIDGVKTYVHSKTTSSDDKVSKYLGYATESDCVYYFKAETNAWYVKIDNIEYVLGTYSDYTTMCISESTYMTPETSGVTQFPVMFMPKAEAEALAPSEGPADPTELTSIADVLAIANALENQAQTPEKYLVKGTVTEIANDQYGNLYIEDEAGNKIYVYGTYSKDGETRYDKMDPQPKVGDTVTVMGVLSKYNDAPQMKNVWVQELVAGNGGTAPEPETPAEPENNTSGVVDGASIVIYYPEGGKYVTGTDFLYSEKKHELELSDSKADALVLTVKISGDKVTFVTADNKYLMCDGTNVQLVDAENENTKFVLESTTGGYFIKCATATYYDKPQYLEVYSGYLTCYSMKDSGTEIFIFDLQVQ